MCRILQAQGIPSARGSGVKVGLLPNATNAVADALGVVVKRRALEIVSKKIRALKMGLILGKYRTTHMVDGSIVPNGEIFWMPLDSNLQITESVH